MWPFLKRINGTEDDHRRPTSFEELIDSMGDFSDLEKHDASLKFWIPEPVAVALKEIKKLRSESINETLLIFLLGHCYGFYFQQTLLYKHPEVYRDPDGLADVRFSNRQRSDDDREPKRKPVYYVPELGKNIFPIKLWIPRRLKDDLERLAQHVNLTLSEYTREIVISRVFGHGMLPMRPKMLEVMDGSLADAWSESEEGVSWTEVSHEEYLESLAGRCEMRDISDEDGLT